MGWSRLRWLGRASGRRGWVEAEENQEGVVWLGEDWKKGIVDVWVTSDSTWSLIGS